MPVYEYECSTCKHRFERSQRFSDPPIQECPECGSPVRRVIFPAGIVFKGSGWYVTDSRSTPSDSSSSTASSSTNNTTKSDSSTETKTAGTASKSESSTAASSAKSS